MKTIREALKDTLFESAPWYYGEFGRIDDKANERVEKTIDLILNIVVERLPKERAYYKYEPRSGEGWNLAIQDVKDLLMEGRDGDSE